MLWFCLQQTSLLILLNTFVKESMALNCIKPAMFYKDYASKLNK